MRALLFAVALCAALACAAAAEWHVGSYSQSVMLKIDMLDEQTGYIAGADNGIGASIIRTLDGGETFTRMQTTPTVMFSGIAGCKHSNVVASGMSVGGLGGPQFASKNGTQFTNASLPESTNYFYNLMVAKLENDTPLSFVMPGTIGFWNVTAQNPSLLISGDGGQTWKVKDLGLQQYPGVDARYAAFVGGNVAFVASGTWPMSAAKKTQNGMAITERLRVQHRVRGSMRQPQLDQQLQLRTTEQLKARAHKRSRKGQPNGGYYGIVQLSTDGMQTFKTLVVNTTWYPNAICCPTESLCILTAENSANGFVLRSTDGGASWTESLVVPGASFMACETVSETEVWVGGGLMAQSGLTGLMYHTADGGQSWAMDQVDGFYPTSIDCVSSEQCYATAANVNGTSFLLSYY